MPGAKGLATVNLMSAGATASAGAAAADLLTDLKSGYLLGANPRKQFIAQMFGVLFGTLAIVPAWYAMVPTKQALEAFNPPSTYMWKAVADLLTQGIHMLPVTAVWAIVIGAVVGVVLPVLGKLFPKANPFPKGQSLFALCHGFGSVLDHVLSEQSFLRAWRCFGSALDQNQ
jgi:uncharacterized oligopeptide transporter (OPT) family protein